MSVPKYAADDLMAQFLKEYIDNASPRDGSATAWHQLVAVVQPASKRFSLHPREARLPTLSLERLNVGFAPGSGHIAAGRATATTITYC
jgi:hypothetical protein